MKLLFFGFGLILSMSSFAKTVVLRAPSANAKDYQAFVLSSPEYEFPSRVLLRDLPSSEDRENLTTLFAKAQNSFIEGSLTQAKEDFENVVTLAETDQWGEEEQSVLLHSYLRLAQLSQDPSEIQEWLRKAVAWTPLGRWEARLFPPPLIEQIQKLKTSIHSLTVSTNSFSSDFDFLVMNGQVVDLKNARQFEVKEGPLRVTLLSDTYQPVNLQTTADQLTGLTPEKRPWAEGSCWKPQLHWQKAGQIAKPYFAKTCAPMKTPSKTDLELSYHPTLQNSATEHSEPRPVPPAPLETRAQARVPFYEKTWFWVGVGAVVTGVVVASLSNQHSTSHPASQEDF